jgi:hypothetical protein
LQRSFRGGHPAPEFVAAVRAAEFVFIREVTDASLPVMQAQIMAWTGLWSIGLPVFARTLPLLRSYADQAENEGERSLALKAITLIDAIRTVT